jgi:isochorismate synthase
VSPKRRADLEAAAQAALDAADRNGETQWVGLQAEISHCDALAAFAISESEDRFYWERPVDERSIAAFGRAGVIEVEGRRRFAEASERTKQLFARLHVAGQAAPATAGPFFVGGFGFAHTAPREPHWRDFPAGRLILPEVAIAVSGGRTWCTLIRTVQSDERLQSGIRAREIADALSADFDEVQRSLANRRLVDASSVEAVSPPDYRARADRTHAEYRAQVEAALNEIAAGRFEKVVLARSICVREAGDYDPCALLDALRRAHPTCAIFAAARPGVVFLGATPECLVRLVDGRVETASVAGSAPRGRSPEEDLELGRQLRESKKEQTEHAFVVRALCDAIAPHCDGLEVRESPRLMRLQDIQHLETPISGRLREPRSILELVGAVHPTPAIAGAPREEAIAWLSANEKLDRGWYSAPIGFVDSDGGGEFYAALRSAILRGSEARLFAGAGVVDGSDPEAELRETRLKLRAMLAPLTEI